MKAIKEPQFKELKFKNERELNQWLSKNADKIIYLEDSGQDLQKIWIAKSGEILHCNAQGSIWCGLFINTDRLIEGIFIEMWGVAGKKQWKQMDFMPDKIEINSKRQIFYLKQRNNPQFKKPYYVRCGQMSKREASKREKSLYGDNVMLPFETEKEYNAEISRLKKLNYSIH